MKNNLDFMMRSRNLSVLDLSRATGISRGTIYRLLDGDTPSVPTMTKLANYFERPLGDLFCA